MEKILSVIIPARNEEMLIGATIEAILTATSALSGNGHQAVHLDETPVELLVVDNDSTDGTVERIGHYVAAHGVRLVDCHRLNAPCARNAGAAVARGRVLCFVDADTVIPPNSLARIVQWTDAGGYEAGITGLTSLEPSFTASCWWFFWEHVRRLPLAHAKAMPAFMFCTRHVFDELGPFDERVAIGEEWPILAGLYRTRPHRFVYDRALKAMTSSRRMDLQRFGYLRTFARYVWAVLIPSGRTNYSDRVRHRPTGAPP